MFSHGFPMVFPWFSPRFERPWPSEAQNRGVMPSSRPSRSPESTFEAVASNSWKQPWGVQRIVGICRGIYIHKDDLIGLYWIQILCKTSFTREKWMNDDDDDGGGGGDDDDPQ